MTGPQVAAALATEEPAADGSTLKAGVETTSTTPVLTVANPQGKYASTAFRYRFETRRVEVDGANGPWSITAVFVTPRPVTLEPTTSPINGATVSTLRPTLVVANGEVTGAAGTVTYQFAVDDSSAFSSPESTFSVTRSGSGTTSGLVTVNLTAGMQYYWQVRGTNGTLTSSWSGNATLLTSASAPPPPPGGPSAPPAPNPGGQLPLPNTEALVNQAATGNPGALANSCQDAGGS